MRTLKVVGLTAALSSVGFSILGLIQLYGKVAVAGMALIALLATFYVIANTLISK